MQVLTSLSDFTIVRKRKSLLPLCKLNVCFVPDRFFLLVFFYVFCLCIKVKTCWLSLGMQNETLVLLCSFGFSILGDYTRCWFFNRNVYGMCAL